MSISFEEKNEDDDKFLYRQALESNEICLKLAEEIKTLRAGILVLKEDKRTWLLSKQALESEITQSRNVSQALKLEVMQLNQENISLRIQLSEKNHVTNTNQHIQENCEDIVHKMELKHKCFADLLVVEKKKSRLLGRELEQSLGDELAVRSHCLRLESDMGSMKTDLERKHSALRNETSLRKQLEDHHESHVSTLKSIYAKLKCVADKLVSSNVSGSKPTNKSQVNELAPTRIGDDTVHLVKVVSAGVNKLLERNLEARVYMKRLVSAVRQYEDLSTSRVCEWEQQQETRDSGDESEGDS